MESHRCILTLVILVFLKTLGKTDAAVFCVFKETCALPCSFKSGPNVFLHWFKGNLPVHSYYNGQNQLVHQVHEFKGRTSLFVNEISRGNASLLLTDAKVNDEGRYTCFTKTQTTASMVSYVQLSMQAPINAVTFERREDKLVCESKNIYPKPDVICTLSPILPHTEQKTSVFESENGLYSMVSSVRPLPSTAYEYSCNVSTQQHRKSATYRMNSPISLSGTITTIPCTTSTVSKAPTQSLVWKFNHNETILTRAGAELVYNKSWVAYVKAVTESDLILINLNSDQCGLYSCVVLRSDSEYVVSTQLGIQPETYPKEPGTTAQRFAIFITVLVVIFCLVGLAVIFFYGKVNSDISTITLRKHPQRN